MFVMISVALGFPALSTVARTAENSNMEKLQGLGERAYPICPEMLQPASCEFPFPTTAKRMEASWKPVASRTGT